MPAVPDVPHTISSAVASTLFRAVTTQVLIIRGGHVSKTTNQFNGPYMDGCLWLQVARVGQIRVGSPFNIQYSTLYFASAFRMDI